MGSSVEPKFRGLRHSSRLGGLVAPSRLYRLRRVHTLFESCLETPRDNDRSRQPRRAFATVSKLMVVSLSVVLGTATISLTGCAQFEDSFGELRVKQSATPTISQHADPARSNEFYDDAHTEKARAIVNGTTPSQGYGWSSPPES